MDESDPIFVALAWERLERIVFQGFPYLVVHPTLGVSPIVSVSHQGIICPECWRTIS